jgi:hypothetical protein
MTNTRPTAPPPALTARLLALALALTLALPLYPKSAGATLGETVHAPDGIRPLRDADLRPFAGLSGLALRPASGDETDPGSAADPTPGAPDADGD